MLTVGLDSFALHSISQGALLPQAMQPQTRITVANSGKLLLLLGANHVQIGHDSQTSGTCSVFAKLLNGGRRWWGGHAAA